MQNIEDLYDLIVHININWTRFNITVVNRWACKNILISRIQFQDLELWKVLFRSYNNPKFVSSTVTTISALKMCHDIKCIYVIDCKYIHPGTQCVCLGKRSAQKCVRELGSYACFLYLFYMFIIILYLRITSSLLQ